ncbi:MAG: 5-formyltetrahydrofolate cyclo-ligase [Spirochaetales bacterium]|nr:5-formyltetrahydrofolate cyclo-ligase [Spirochaetales bacterium]
MNKEEIREAMKKLNKTRKDVDHRSEDAATVTALLGSELFYACDWVFGFMPLHCEVDVTPVLQEALRAKRLALPRSNGDDTLTFVEVKSLDELAPGRFGILEPRAGAEVRPTSYSLIIVPALAYTPKRVRLGRGKGFYDRYLERFPDPVSIGVCRTWQLIEDLPVGIHDRQVDTLLCSGIRY